MNKHDHTKCDHDIEYCEECDVCYCTKCNTEWTTGSLTWTGTGGGTTILPYTGDDNIISCGSTCRHK